MAPNRIALSASAYTGGAQLVLSTVLVVLALGRLHLDTGLRWPRHSSTGKLAVVVPFVAREIKTIETNIASWDTFIPCTEADDDQAHISPDLIFYFSGDLGQHSELVWQLKQLTASTRSIRQCFGKVAYLSALLTPQEDTYPIGPSFMFFRLFTLPRVRTTYDGIYLMEADNHPCRTGWLDQLRRDLTQSAWMMGSIRRDGIETGAFADHINGNALYWIGDLAFQAFVERVHFDFVAEPSKYLSSFDIALHTFRLNRSIVTFAEYAATKHLFMYSVTMQNWYRTSVNATDVCAASPNTFLVHGRHVYY